jgi:hypothetical protein
MLTQAAVLITPAVLSNLICPLIREPGQGYPSLLLCPWLLQHPLTALSNLARPPHDPWTTPCVLPFGPSHLLIQIHHLAVVFPNWLTNTLSNDEHLGCHIAWPRAHHHDVLLDLFWPS